LFLVVDYFHPVPVLALLDPVSELARGNLHPIPRASDRVGRVPNVFRKSRVPFIALEHKRARNATTKHDPTAPRIARSVVSRAEIQREHINQATSHLDHRQTQESFFEGFFAVWKVPSTFQAVRNKAPTLGTVRTH
jgi:hypothetical protein